MRRRGDRVIIINGMYEGHKGTVEANVYQKTVDYPEELANGYHIMLDTEKLVTVRWDQVEPAPGRRQTRTILRHQGSVVLSGGHDVQISGVVVRPPPIANLASG